MFGRRRAEEDGSPHGQFGGFVQPTERANAQQAPKPVEPKDSAPGDAIAPDTNEKSGGPDA